MIRFLLVLISSLCFGILSLESFADTPPKVDALSIMTKVRDRDTGKSSEAYLTMTLLDKKGSKRTKEFKVLTKEYPKLSKSLACFQKPKDIKGTVFLTYDYETEDDNTWFYLPALKKVKRVATSEKSSSFMGSDFSYHDMSKPTLTEYNYEFQKEDKVDGHNAWRIKAEAKTSAMAQKIGYTKSILWVRQDNYVVVKAAHWLTEKGQYKFFEAKELKLINSVWWVTEAHMTLKEGKSFEHKTTLIRKVIKSDHTLQDKLFETRQLEKGC